ncbi:hypothetical protein M7I_7760 [Glarea lozoyensis 74030]|uniref:Uncharacterized protein n=1 Tax=Glarea lozoyensis (strain ATCC 74030 / MF5533) TaxID=1104152 RepID=H0EY63_GLAL7|nr:hypothetical protein M7I_7760 [Glarea lozoyensis 74030]
MSGRSRWFGGFGIDVEVMEGATRKPLLSWEMIGDVDVKISLN